MSRLRRMLASDIPFARDDAHRLLPWMIACLIGFAALLFAVSLSLSGALDAQSQAALGTLQIELPRSKAASPAWVEQVIAEVKRTPGVESVTPLTEKQMEDLLKPWLGDDFSLADLPLPLMLEVTSRVKDSQPAVNLEALRTALTRLDSDIRLETRAPWVGQMAHALALFQMVLMAVAGLLLACVVGMVVLVARTTLRLHFKAVNLLHLFGATDDYILRQFQWNGAWLAARGAFTGVLIAATLFAAAVALSLRWHNPVLPPITVSVQHVAMFLLLPLLTSLIALIATRATVRRMLEPMR